MSDGLAEGIYATLKADAGVLVALGPQEASQYAIYPVRAPNGALFPNVVFFQVTSSNNEPHTGPSPMDDTWMQFSCYGSTYEEARNLRRAVRAAMEGKTLAGGEVPVDFTERDQYVNEIDAFHCILECHVLHDALAGAT